MEWQDTILTGEQLGEIDKRTKGHYEALRLVAKAQAEATWKAVMQEKCFESYEMGVEDGRRKGMREVAEWVEDNRCRFGLMHYCPNCDHQIVGMSGSAWQAFKKEKGL